MTKIVNISGAEITDTGIQRLVEYCRDTLTDNYTLIIGCLPYNSDIDAILIGNGNIYAVECKHWKGEIEGSTYGHWTKDGESISNPLHQTRNNTVALARWLREKTGLNGSLWVRGLLVFTHDHCQVHITRDNGSNNGVEVILLSDLKGYLERQERTVREEVVSKVVGVFEGMKNIEFYNRKGVKIMEKHTLNSHITPRDLAEEELINEANLLGIDLEKGSIWQTLKGIVVSLFKDRPVVLTSDEKKDWDYWREKHNEDDTSFLQAEIPGTSAWIRYGGE